MLDRKGLAWAIDPAKSAKIAAKISILANCKSLKNKDLK